MISRRWLSSALLVEIAGWLCLLGALALVALATSGTLETLLTLAVVVAGVVAVYKWRPGTAERPGRGRAAPVLVALVPLFVAFTIADAVASEEWLVFTTIAIVFPLGLAWRHVYRSWQARRASPDTT
jgi:hypothetical protein